ncbi:hypothetical protein SAMN05428997_102218 [Bosea sp. CRIB-10]|uniref:hypothetical protein n=1 Tax=Bosea sp. CRIB-10 TaxID=378404 RepID=UPI0008F0A7DE|nr:hypothetical protein [Bosea sp. CRIB-10]SFB82161.1 hypothetical protein SAMN05428997_102218 [Bosea sp. CRIB-10]
MRLAADDVTRSLAASWRLLWADAKALPDLDLSRDGFWRSYLALVLVVPSMIPALAAERTLAGLSNSGSLFDAPGLLAAVVTTEILAVLAVPALLIGIAPNLAQNPRFTGFIIAWNWAGIVSAALMAVPATVFALGWSNPGIATFQTLAFATIVLRLRYCVARAAFGTESGVAGAIACASLLADYAVIRTFGLAGF